jgi:L-aspartate semialdehyde sulfurtransferase ferredoxin
MKKRFVFRFSPGTVKQPLISHLVREFDIDANIWNADISYGREGKLVVELEASEEAIQAGLEYTRSIGVHWSPLVKELQFRQDECVDCGSCTSVCFYGALSMNPTTWKLEFDPEQCVVCGLCVKACPLRLFSISREEEE